jgi:NAD kinase
MLEAHAFGRERIVLAHLQVRARQLFELEAKQLGTLHRRLLRPEAVLRIAVGDMENDAILTIDGQESIKLAGGDVLVARRGQKAVCLVRSPDRTYYDVLRAKLGWGARQGGEHASHAARL